MSPTLRNIIALGLFLCLYAADITIAQVVHSPWIAAPIVLATIAGPGLLIMLRVAVPKDH